MNYRDCENKTQHHFQSIATAHGQCFDIRVKSLGSGLGILKNSNKRLTKSRFIKHLLSVKQKYSINKILQLPAQFIGNMYKI